MNPTTYTNEIRFLSLSTNKTFYDFGRPSMLRVPFSKNHVQM